MIRKSNIKEMLCKNRARSIVRISFVKYSKWRSKENEQNSNHHRRPAENVENYSVLDVKK